MGAQLAVRPYSIELEMVMSLEVRKNEKKVAFEELNPTFSGLCWVTPCLTQTTIFHKAKGIDYHVRLITY
ncbi:hypothetical protein [Nostoc sp.]|uniref:hypothetical protein n=1 Tax=Nostoc sp. TaxID=1180 RepID=UPI002FF961C0